MSIRFGGSDRGLETSGLGGLAVREQRTFRLAVDRFLAPPVRGVVTTKDEETQQFNEDVAIYTNYQLRDSVWCRFRSPATERPPHLSIFLRHLQVQSGLSRFLFTKDSSERASEELIQESQKLKTHSRSADLDLLFDSSERLESICETFLPRAKAGHPRWSWASPKPSPPRWISNPRPKTRTTF